MKKLFLCLANSKKYNERCIAGIELTRDGNGKYDIVKNADNRPKWLRPVTTAEHGQVPEKVVEKMQILDVWEIDVKRECPKNYQSENILFDPKSLRKIHHINRKSDNFNNLIEREKPFLFGCEGKTVPHFKIAEVNHSLVLVKGEKVQIYESKIRRFRIRVSFYYRGYHYDLPVTDVNFFDKYWEDNSFVTNAKDFFITVSLGVEFEEKYYKLAAGVICI